MSEPQKQFVISITSRDRVGIVYEVSKAISELNGNIADIRQSVLCGYFTMILLAFFPAEITQRAIERKLAELDAHSETAMDALVRKVEGSYVPFTPMPENVYVLTATGPDRIGFVATVASFCVQHNINILDLSTTVSNGEYVMILIIDLKKISVSINAVRQDLQQFAAETSLKVVLQHYDIFRAVNEINLPIR
jgi:glycine cleavage system transcriptional repressor